ncbi:Ppx/GppA phosphatase family protein [Sandaracinus amylolyticus]|uniref:Ppx/GppA phosphatase family protein n=1 Tax=Sandaracinus amylolyticus TaxID=927083 RepID=UPI001F422C5E|nr:Ppx/GppA phosphatase family protein [Sandaracinus amylolyticus]UJR83051.1 Hypothetical protein I5071_51170 [Sandaracinus amylolyticus]
MARTPASARTGAAPIPCAERTIALASAPAEDADHPRVAALDLGSNSFHLVLASIERGTPHVYDRRRERVALGSGLRDGRPLDRAARARAIACLERFSELVRPLPAGRVRIVGTDSLRRASDGPELVARAEKLLGHRVEIVPGPEEARLVWRGVSAMHPPSARERRLVVDIGGGSTEVVVGTGWTPREAHSTPMGCIRFTERFFPDARISRKRYERARDAAMLELRPFAARMRAAGIDRVLGSSGTMRAIGEIVEAGRGAITRRGVDALIEKVCDADTLADVDVEGLADERRPVLPGGLAIVDAVMRTFELGRIDVADGALREGLLMELVGRLESDDVRDDTIAAFRARHGIDAAHARRVRETAETLFDAVASDWELGDVELRRWLGWAAELHELGLSVSRSGVARHGAYLIANADAPGFSRDELEAIATLVRTHRGRLRRDMFEPRRRGSRRALKRLSVLLRIAVALHADRAKVAVIPSARAARRKVELTVPPEWTASRALVAAELAEHASHIQRIGLELGIRTAEA